MTIERVTNIATIVLASCAVVLTALAVRREFVPSSDLSRRQLLPRAQRDWADYADGHILGDANAPTTIVEFADFQCPFCRKFAHYTDSLRARGLQFKVVYRHFPLSSHRFAVDAARASECASAQGRFQQMHDALYAHSDSVGVAPWLWFGRIAGVSDTASFDACSRASGPIAALARDTTAGRRLGVDATPTLLIGSARLDGVPSFDSLAIYVSRAAKKTTP